MRPEVLSVYKKQKEGESFHFSKMSSHENLSFFRFGRNAIYAWLKEKSYPIASSILVPHFICRDVLSSIYSLGLKPEFYDVDKKLNTIFPEATSAKALIFVNYFGFPQDLSAHQSFAKKNSLDLLEDNTHALFSKDSQERWLGFRGVASVLSFRKTLHVPFGAALVSPNSDFLGTSSPRSALIKASLRFRGKEFLKATIPVFGLLPLRGILKLGRLADREFIGQVEDEFQLPQDGPLPQILFDRLNRLSVLEEIMRRRELYTFCLHLSQRHGLEAVFSVLPNGVSPYGFAFKADIGDFKKLSKVFSKEKLDIFTWPQLPSTQRSPQDFYNKIQVVRFLW